MKKTLKKVISIVTTFSILLCAFSNNTIVYANELNSTQIASDNGSFIQVLEVPNQNSRVIPIIINNKELRNVKTTYKSINSNIIVSSDSVLPSTTIKLTLTNTYTTSISGTSSISAKEFNMMLQLSQSSSISLEKEISYTCPYMNDGKYVNRCDVTYYPYYQNYSFDVYMSNINFGSGTAKALVGFYQDVDFEYK